MTAVTGKFVLKCRTTNIATLFDISLFYVYKFYFISNLTGISRILLFSPWGRGKGEGLLVMCYMLFFIFHPPFHSSIHNLLHAVENLIDITLLQFAVALTTCMLENKGFIMGRITAKRTTFNHF